MAYNANVMEYDHVQEPCQILHNYAVRGDFPGWNNTVATGNDAPTTDPDRGMNENKSGLTNDFQDDFESSTGCNEFKANESNALRYESNALQLSGRTTSGQTVAGGYETVGAGAGGMMDCNDYELMNGHHEALRVQSRDLNTVDAAIKNHIDRDVGWPPPMSSIIEYISNSNAVATNNEIQARIKPALGNRSRKIITLEKQI